MIGTILLWLLGILFLPIFLLTIAVVIRTALGTQHWRVVTLDFLSHIADALCHTRKPASKFNRKLFEFLAGLGPSHRPIAASSEKRCKCEDLKISEHASVRLFTPHTSSTAAEPLRVMLYIHGGGHVLFHNYTADFHNLCARFASKGNMLVASVEYRLAPEHPFPAGLEDAHVALDWVANSNHPGLDVCGAPGKRKVIVAGDSAGGNVAAVLALLARDGKSTLLQPAPVIPLEHVILIYPSMSDPSTASRKATTRSTYILHPNSMAFFSEATYGSIPLPSSDFRISPANAITHVGLAPHTIIAASEDPLVDEGVAYTERLRAAWVVVQHRNMKNMVHGFFTWHFLPATRHAFEFALAAATGAEYTIPADALVN
eukprot:m.28292 g.28292  ORF g.28292 m.28292 type:complete len:373 (-) comp9074_c0_seq1:95-1213(-)